MRHEVKDIETARTSWLETYSNHCMPNSSPTRIPPAKVGHEWHTRVAATADLAKNWAKSLPFLRQAVEFSQKKTTVSQLIGTNDVHGLGNIEVKSCHFVQSQPTGKAQLVIRRVINGRLADL